MAGTATGSGNPLIRTTSKSKPAVRRIGVQETRTETPGLCNAAIRSSAGVAVGVAAGIEVGVHVVPPVPLETKSVRGEAVCPAGFQNQSVRL